MAEINLESLEQGSLKKKIICKKNFYEHPQSESQPGFPFFLNFFEEKFFWIILKKE